MTAFALKAVIFLQVQKHCYYFKMIRSKVIFAVFSLFVILTSCSKKVGTKNKLTEVTFEHFVTLDFPSEKIQLSHLISNSTQKCRQIKDANVILFHDTLISNVYLDYENGRIIRQTINTNNQYHSKNYIDIDSLFTHKNYGDLNDFYAFSKYNDSVICLTTNAGVIFLNVFTRFSKRILNSELTSNGSFNHLPTRRRAGVSNNNNLYFHFGGLSRRSNKKHNVDFKSFVEYNYQDNKAEVLPFKFPRGTTVYNLSPQTMSLSLINQIPYVRIGSDTVLYNITRNDSAPEIILKGTSDLSFLDSNKVEQVERLDQSMKEVFLKFFMINKWSPVFYFDNPGFYCVVGFKPHHSIFNKEKGVNIKMYVFADIYDTDMNFIKRQKLTETDGYYEAYSNGEVLALRTSPSKDTTKNIFTNKIEASFEIFKLIPLN